MITAQLSVEYPDWTAELGSADAEGMLLTSYFHESGYVGLFAFEARAFDAVVEAIRSDGRVASIQVVERYTPERGLDGGVLVVREAEREETAPLQILQREGVLPYGPTELRDGREFLTILAEEHEDVSRAVDALDEVACVEVSRVSQNFSWRLWPNHAEWQTVLDSISARQAELLVLALERGYFEIPREVTLTELADEFGVTKTTASHYIRKAQNNLMEFVIKYLGLSQELRGPAGRR